MEFEKTREKIRTPLNRGGRGNIAYPEFLELEVSDDGREGDCLVYEDSPDNRKRLILAKCKYNAATTGKFAERYFTHRNEIRSGRPVIVIQRIK